MNMNEEMKKIIILENYQNPKNRGLIDDNTYHIEMRGKLAPSGIAKLSGTGFNSTKINTSDTTSNTDPLVRSLTPEGGDMAKSNANKTTKDQQKGKDLN